jgi:hypothetical protein
MPRIVDGCQQGLQKPHFLWISESHEHRQCRLAIFQAIALAPKGSTLSEMAAPHG